jgi:hypothetical protein
MARSIGEPENVDLDASGCALPRDRVAIDGIRTRVEASLIDDDPVAITRSQPRNDDGISIRRLRPKLTGDLAA